MKKKGDSHKRMLLISAAIFTVIILLHALRITKGWDAQIGSISIPLWASGIVVLLGLILLFFILKAYKQ